MLDDNTVDNTVDDTVLHLHQSSNPAPVSACAFQGDWSLPSYPGCALLALYRALGNLLLGFCTLKDVPFPKAFQPITSKGTAWFSTHHRHHRAGSRLLLTAVLTQPAFTAAILSWIQCYWLSIIACPHSGPHLQRHLGNIKLLLCVYCKRKNT